MALIRWNPMSLSSLLEDDWELPTLPGLSRLGQGLNLYETESEIVAEAALPGIKEDAVDVTYENGVLRISAANQSQSENNEERRYFMTSRATSFNYSFRLPETLVGNQEPICELEDGVLTVRFKKAEKVAPKKIAVKKITPAKK